MAGMRNAAKAELPGVPDSHRPRSMPNTPPGSRPDPMMREVNRLLAQLEQTAPRLEASTLERAREAPQQPSQIQVRTHFAGVAASIPTRGSVPALWAGVFLGIALGAMMTQWPYPRECGLQLLGYLGAVATVLIAGAGIAFDSWRLRNAPAHVLSLILIFWAIVLAAEQVLPRIGYAEYQASWRCAQLPAADSTSPR